MMLLFLLAWLGECSSRIQQSREPISEAVWRPCLYKSSGLAFRVAAMAWLEVSIGFHRLLAG